MWRRPRTPTPLPPPSAVPSPSLALKETLQGFAQDAWLPHPGLLHGAALNTAVFMLGYPILRKGLTAEGVAHAWALGAGTWSAFGPSGYALLCIYFVLGTLVRLAAGRGPGMGEGQGKGKGSAMFVRFGRKLVWSVGWMRALVTVWKSYTGSRFSSNHFRPISPFTNHRICTLCR